MKRMDQSPMIHPGMDTMLICEGAGDEAWIRHGKVNGAIALDRINDYLAIQGLYYSTTGEIQEITVSCWIKTTQANTEGVILSFDRSEF